MPQKATEIEFFSMDSAQKDGALVLIETAPNVVQAAYWDAEFEYTAVGDGCGHRWAWTDGTVESWGDQTNRSFKSPLRWAPMPLPKSNG